MAQSIILVGGLPSDPLRNEILNRLSTRSGAAIKWDWLRADLHSLYRPPEDYVRRLLTQLKQVAAGNDANADSIVVVKLPLLNGATANLLHKHCDPIQLPTVLQQMDEQLDWLFSEQANLIPRHEWFGNLQEAALAAILAKLVKNKSWNKDTQGHAWTKEEDLLGQAPVLRSDHQIIAVEAKRILYRLEKRLFFKKGGTPGTPKEWSIRLTYVGLAKQMILSQSFTALNGISELESLRDDLIFDDDRCYRIDQEIVTEKVRGICRLAH